MALHQSTPNDAHDGDGLLPDARPDIGVRIVILAGGLIASLALVAITSVLPQIDKALAHTPFDSLLVKQLIGAVALTMVIGSTLVGFLIDRIGIRRIMLVAATIYVVAGTAGLYLADLNSLLVSRLFVGLTASSVQVACITLINTRLEGPVRARWMGLHISVAMLTAIFVHPIAGALGEVSWRLPFALYGLGLVLVPAAFMLREAPPTQGAEAKDDASGSLWRNFPLHYLLLALAVGTLALMPSVQVPFLLRDKGLSSPTTIALVLTADSVVGALVAMLYGTARTRISAHAAFACSFLAASIGLLLAAIGGSLAMVICGLLIYGLGIGWFVPNLMTALSTKVAPHHQARAAGIVKAAHFLSAPLALVLVEPLARSHGPGGAILAAAFLAVACLGATLVRMLKVRNDGQGTRETPGALPRRGGLR